MINNLSKLKIETFTLLPTRRIFSYQFKSDINSQYAGILLENNTIVLNPKLVSQESDLIGIIAHEVLHDILQHIPRLKFFLGKYCSRHDEILWNLAGDEIVNRMLIEIAEKKKKDEYIAKIKNTGVNLSNIYGDKIKDFSIEILYRFLKENTEIDEIKKDKIKILNNKEIEIITCLIFDKQTGKLIYRYNKLILVERNNDGSIKNEVPIAGTYVYELQNNLLGAGIVSNTLNKEIEMIKSPLSLKNYLKNYLNTIKSGLEDITFLKHGKLNIIFPNSNLQYPSYISRKCKIVIGVDVSASISDENFAEFISIIYSNINFFEGKIYFCDTEIKSEIDLIDKSEDEIKDIYKKLKIRTGYGGTLFEPVFEKAKEVPDIDLLIYFTDLFPFQWPKTPKFKVLWIVKATIESFNINVPFGKVIFY